MGLPFPSPFLDPQANFSTGINFASGGSGLLDSTNKEMVSAPSCLQYFIHQICICYSKTGRILIVEHIFFYTLPRLFWPCLIHLLLSLTLQNIISLRHQISQFTHFDSTLVKKDGSIAAEFYLSESLYCISIGGNDINSYMKNVTFQSTTAPKDLVTSLLKKYDQYLTVSFSVFWRFRDSYYKFAFRNEATYCMILIQTLYRSGARKFVLSDISTVGCTPSARYLGYNTSNGECLNKANKLAKEYNVGLKKLLNRAMQKLKGAIILQPNSYNFSLSVIENGEAYGT